MGPTRRVVLPGNQKGFALVYVALMIFVLFGALGLAVDVGHLYVVRGQLQNAADAAALAGAWSLYRDPARHGELPVLNWERARTAASDIIKKNKTDGIALKDGTIEAGYWSPLNPDAPLSTVLTDPKQREAVRAVVSRSEGNNGGPVSTFFMKLLDIEKVRVSSRASVATSGFPGKVAPGLLFPMALSNCMTDEIFSRPPSQWPGSIDIDSPYGHGGHCPSSQCYSGQWTSFKQDKNDVPTIRNLMLNGNPDPLKIGDSIWIQPGTKATLFQTNKWTPPLPAEGKEVIMAIVDTKDTKTKGRKTITGFAAFHIDGAVATGSNKRIYGHFIAYYEKYPAGISTGGPRSNIVAPAVLVK